MHRKMLFLIGVLLLVSLVAVWGCGGTSSAGSSSTTAAAPSTTAAGSPSTTASAPSTTAASTGGAEKVIKIGAIENLTGPASDVLKIVGDGDMLAQDWINNVRGGIKVNGETYKVQIVMRDNKMTTEGAVAAAQELISDQKVQFMVGSMPPFITMAIDSVTEPNKVVYCCPLHTGTLAELTKDTPYKFVTQPDNWALETDTIAYLHEQHPEVKTLVYVNVDDGQIKDNEPVVKAACEKYGIQFLGSTVGWTLDTVDFAPTVQKALAQKPDAIMTGNGSTECTGQVLKLAREQGFTGPIVACNSNPPQDVIKIAGQSASTNWSGYGITEEYPDMTDLTKQLVSMAVKAYGRLDYNQLEGFNAVYTIVQGIEKAQSLDSTKVKEALESMDTIDTAFGPAKLGGLQSYGLNHILYHPVSRIIFDSGKMVYAPWRHPYMP
jgi:branched-chain amino acid transport system substrate-binding protein